MAAWLKSSFIIIDTFYAGRLGTAPLAAMASATLFCWVFQSLSQINSLGAMSLCAHATGAGDREQLQVVMRRSLALAAGLGTVVSLLVVLGAGRVIAWQGLPDGVGEGAYGFLSLLCLFGPAYWIYDTLERGLQATGDTRTPLLVTGIIVAANAVLNPLFALGWGPVPAMGLRGIAFATGICWLLGALILYGLVRQRGLLARVARPARAVPAAAIWRIGSPAALSAIAFDLIWLVMMPLIGRDGPAAIAAVTIGHNLESVGFMASVGIGAACTALVGQAMGMGRLDLVRRVAWRSAFAGFVFSALWSLMLLYGQPTLYGWYTQDPTVLAFGHDYVIWVISVLGFQAVGFVLVDAFAGIGSTGLASAVTLMTYGLRIPLAFWLVGHYGSTGAFMAIGITAAASGLAMLSAFQGWLVRHGVAGRRWWTPAAALDR